VLTDAGLYFTAPLRWDVRDWMYFASAAAVVAGSHQLDRRARDHFAGPNAVLDGKDKHSLRDAIPAAAATVSTWAFASLSGSDSGRNEAYTMLEAAGFSAITTEALKYAAGRRRPNETTRIDDWRAGGSSFPSLHASAAFAIGTVLAESGPDDFRWLRRIVGYGLGAGTAYLRVHDNAHWLSDTAASAAIGISTGAFVVNRHDARARNVDISVSPATGGGVMISVAANLD